MDGGSLSSAQCDLVGDAGCPCLRIATLGYPGTRKKGDIFTDWLDEKLPQGVVHLESAVLTSNVLAAHQVLVIQDVRYEEAGVQGVGSGIGREYTSSEVAALQRWVEQGGGLLTLTGYAFTTELGNINRLLAPLGLSYSSEHLFNDDLASVPVSRWEKHPITDGVGGTGDVGGVGSVGGVRAYGGYQVNGGTSIASIDAYSIGNVREVGLGRVFAWGDESISYTDYLGPANMGVARLWLNTLGWLVAPTTCKLTLPPGT